MFKRNHSPTYAVLEWEQLLRLLPSNPGDGGAAAPASPQRKRQRREVEEREDAIMKGAYADIIRRIRQAEAELAEERAKGAPHSDSV